MDKSAFYIYNDSSENFSKIGNIINNDEMSFSFVARSINPRAFTFLFYIKIFYVVHFNSKQVFIINNLFIIQIILHSS